MSLILRLPYFRLSFFSRHHITFALHRSHSLCVYLSFLLSFLASYIINNTNGTKWCKQDNSYSWPIYILIPHDTTRAHTYIIRYSMAGSRSFFIEPQKLRTQRTFQRIHFTRFTPLHLALCTMRSCRFFPENFVLLIYWSCLLLLSLVLLQLFVVFSATIHRR